MNERFKGLPEAEKEKGLAHIARTPPPDDNESLVVKLWDQHLPAWRERLLSPSEPRDAEEDKKLVEHINRVSNADRLPAHEVDFVPDDAQFVQITRQIAKRKGSWWQLPKDLKVDGNT